MFLHDSTHSYSRTVILNFLISLNKCILLKDELKEGGM